MLKKLTSLIIVFTLALSLSACSSDSKETQKHEEQKKTQEVAAEKPVTEKTSSDEQNKKSTHTVIDYMGNKVEVPDKIERIVIDQIPILSTYMAYFEGKAPYLVGFSGSFKETISQTVLKDICPELNEASETVYAQSDLNIEEIIKLKPDVIFYNANNKKHAEILMKSGIPAVGFATIGGGTTADPINRQIEWLRLLEQVFNQPGKMDKFVNNMNSMAKEIEDKIAEVPTEQRPSAIILFKFQKGVLQVAGKGIFGDFWLQRLGVKNAAVGAKGFAQVNLEQVYDWNPDILFLNGRGLSKISRDDVLNNKVQGIDFSPLKAVTDKKVYRTDLGMWNWFTPNPDAPLVLGWLAKETYPEKFKDYDLNTTVKEYYKTYYNYELSDEQVEEMFEH